MNPSRLITIASAAGVAILTGCASSPTPFDNAPIYNGSAAYQSSAARVVTVESVQLVRLRRQPDGTLQAVGPTVLGGLIGGAAGNTVGGGKGKQLMTVIGGATGAAIGQGVQEASSLVPSYVYTISFYTSEGKVTKTVPQEADNTLQAIAPYWRPGTPFTPVQARFTQGAGGERVLPL